MIKKFRHHKKNYAQWGIISVVLIIVLVVLALGTNQNKDGKQISSIQAASALTAEVPSFDFGRISMANGRVSREIKIKNTDTAPITATRLSTSCMCTSVELSYQGKKEGPFGMPGHGFVPSINTVIQPGDEATVKITFDPAAHGPAGVGAIKRDIYLEQEGNKRLTVSFSAFVTP